MFKEDLEIDVIIGNPPYNKGLDIDFMVNGFNLANITSSMITPAKWQTAEANQVILSKNTYGDFRSEVVPYIDHLVFYPDCREIFNIWLVDGVTWYTTSKQKVKACKVENKCRNIDIFNSVEYRNITNEETLLNICDKILQSMPEYKSFEFPRISGGKKYEVIANTKLSAFDWFDTTQPRYVLNVTRLLNKEDLEEYTGESKCIFESDSLDECKSFLSWLYSKTVRFLLIPNISKLNNIFTEHYFKYVPNIEVFDHIFTDKELQKKYGLEQYSEIIDKLVKVRNIEEMINK